MHIVSRCVRAVAGLGMSCGTPLLSVEECTAVYRSTEPDREHRSTRRLPARPRSQCHRTRDGPATWRRAVANIFANRLWTAGDRRRLQTRDPPRRLRCSAISRGKSNLIAKVRVAGSNPVVRSKTAGQRLFVRGSRQGVSPPKRSFANGVGNGDIGNREPVSRHKHSKCDAPRPVVCAGMMPPQGQPRLCPIGKGEVVGAGALRGLRESRRGTTSNISQRGRPSLMAVRSPRWDTSSALAIVRSSSRERSRAPESKPICVPSGRS
jgi:hypothetical protein